MTFKEQFDEELEEARELGHSAGLKEGIAEGERNAKLETARNLLEMGLSHEQIARATGLKESEIMELEK